jgi:hypothetical protein
VEFGGNLVPAARVGPEPREEQHKNMVENVDSTSTDKLP